MKLRPSHSFCLNIRQVRLEEIPGCLYMHVTPCKRFQADAASFKTVVPIATAFVAEADIIVSAINVTDR